ncbi:MAG: TolB family protein [Planctomycetota bacterium]
MRVLRSNSVWAAVVTLLTAGQLASDVPAQSATLVLASVGDSGQEGSGDSRDAALSADGRFLTFLSNAPDLVPGDTNEVMDAFVRDIVLGTTERVNVSSLGVQANAHATRPRISADGRFVVFSSAATTLVPGDTNGTEDVFVRDRALGETVRVSTSSGGAQANNFSFLPDISADGRFVSFHSYASNLVTGDTNGFSDVFVHDRVTAETRRVSVDSAGVQNSGTSYGAAISSDGRYIAFRSSAADLVPGDTNGTWDIFVHDTLTGAMECVSVSSAGQLGDRASDAPALSADGRWIAYHSSATNLVAGDTNNVPDVFLRDRLLAATTRVSQSTAGAQGDDQSRLPQLSGDGRYVVYQSAASNLVVPTEMLSGMQAYLRDAATGTTTRLSQSASGQEANGWAANPILSADGRYAAFDSTADNLVAGDDNTDFDVFRYGPILGLSEPFTDLGQALPGLNGVPSLAGMGDLTEGSVGALALIGAAPAALSSLSIALTSTPTPFKCGTLVPVPIAASLFLFTDASGAILLGWSSWPAGLSGLSLYFQYAIQDAAAVCGVSLSNALRADVP